MKLSYNLCFSVGDTSSDGHCIHQDYHIVCNYPARKIYEVYRQLVSELHWDFTNECSYDGREVSKKGTKILLEHRIIDKNELETYNNTLHYIVEDENDYVRIFFELIKIKLPDLKWDYRDTKEEYLDILDGTGYGLFYSL
jgi:hypothetical protein